MDMLVSSFSKQAANLILIWAISLLGFILGCEQPPVIDKLQIVTYFLITAEEPFESDAPSITHSQACVVAVQITNSSYLKIGVRDISFTVHSSTGRYYWESKINLDPTVEISSGQTYTFATKRRLLQSLLSSGKASSVSGSIRITLPEVNRSSIYLKSLPLSNDDNYRKIYRLQELPKIDLWMESSTKPTRKTSKQGQVKEKGTKSKPLRVDKIHSTHKYEERIINGDNVIVDHATGLTWQTSGSSKIMNYAGALDYIRQLRSESFAGYDDWRLPTLKEASALFESEVKKFYYIDILFDRKQNAVWTSDKKSTYRVWVVDFEYRTYYDLSGDSYRYIRAVR